MISLSTDSGSGACKRMPWDKTIQKIGRHSGLGAQSNVCNMLNDQHYVTQGVT